MLSIFQIPLATEYLIAGGVHRVENGYSAKVWPQFQYPLPGKMIFYHH
jgi:hypothetical protein